MNALTICNTSVRQADDLYSLNDLHQAAGNDAKYKPVEFLRAEPTKALLTELQKVGNSHLFIKTTKGRNGSTYVCKELVYAYAMWISAAFMLQVIRVFDAVQLSTNPLQLPNLITTAQQGELATLIAERFPDGKSRPYAWSRFNNHFRIASYKNLPAAKFAEACDYITSLPVKQEAAPTLLGRRWLVSYDHNGKEQVTPVPEDAAVMSVEQLLKAISTPGDMPIKTETLAEFCIAVTRRLQERCEYHESKQLRIASQ